MVSRHPRHPPGEGVLDKSTVSRWFKVIFLSPSLRLLNLWKGHVFTIPKTSQRIASMMPLKVINNLIGLFAVRLRYSFASTSLPSMSGTSNMGYQIIKGPNGHGWQMSPSNVLNIAGGTPPKTNMDTQNDGLDKVTPLTKGNFWYLC